jgi:predicted transcriptional regulator
MSTLPTIGAYMARELITLTPNQEINSAMQLLLDRRVSGAPVIGKAGELVGLLTKKDCLRAALEASYYRDWGRPVSAYMARKVQTLDSSTDIFTACQHFLDSSFRRFPVVDEERLVGQISRTDILRAMAENWN